MKKLNLFFYLSIAVGAVIINPALAAAAGADQAELQDAVHVPVVAGAGHVDAVIADPALAPRIWQTPCERNVSDVTPMLSEALTPVNDESHVLVVHGGTLGYVTQWLRGELQGYNLEAGAGLGIQVTPVAILTDNGAVKVNSFGFVSRFRMYATRHASPSDVVGDGNYITPDGDLRFPVGVFILIQKKYLSYAGNWYEAGIRDQARGNFSFYIYPIASNLAGPIMGLMQGLFPPQAPAVPVLQDWLAAPQPLKYLDSYDASVAEAIAVREDVVDLNRANPIDFGDVGIVNVGF